MGRIKKKKPLTCKQITVQLVLMTGTSKEYVTLTSCKIESELLSQDSWMTQKD